MSPTFQLTANKLTWNNFDVIYQEKMNRAAVTFVVIMYSSPLSYI